MSRSRLPLMALLTAGLLVTACTEQGVLDDVQEPATREEIRGTDLYRVFLTPAAAARLGLQTAEVREIDVTRTRTVGGEVVAGDGGQLLVHVLLTESDFEEVEEEAPATVFPIAGADAGSGIVVAPLIVPDPAEDPPSSDESDTLFYILPATGHGLSVGSRVLVEFPMLGGGLRAIVPYGAVIYDLVGETWAYAETDHFAFVREPITVDYILDDTAVLLDGPPAGTVVVVHGAAELLGVELGVGK